MVPDRRSFLRSPTPRASDGLVSRRRCHVCRSRIDGLLVVESSGLPRLRSGTRRSRTVGVPSLQQVSASLRIPPLPPVCWRVNYQTADLLKGYDFVYFTKSRMGSPGPSEVAGGSGAAYLVRCPGLTPLSTPRRRPLRRWSRDQDGVFQEASACGPNSKAWSETLGLC